MKKRLLSLLLILALALSLCAAAVSAEESYVFDEAGRVSAEELEILQQLGARIRADTGAVVCVCITEGTGPDLRSYAAQFWQEHFDADEGIILVYNPAANMISYAAYGERLGTLDESELNELAGAFNSANTCFEGAHSFMNLAYAKLGGPGLEESETRQYDRVVDLAGVLDADTLAELNRMANDVSGKYACDVAVAFVRSLDGKYVQDYSDDFFWYNGYGQGPERDGILLLISVGDREFNESTSGYGTTAFTDYGLQQYIEPNFTRYLVNGRDDWAGAARQFITDAGELLRQARDGKPYDYEYDSPAVVEREKKTAKEVAPGAALISAIIGFFSGGIPAGAMKRKMKSVEKNYGAGNYARGGLRMRRSDDRFLYANVHRTPIPHEEHRTGGGGGGGSSMHFSSSGHSFGGSHGKF
ncbi:MAG: TPM domain-containing protein [Oscillospiraceae bacterium]|nr:TPM domain-containing protein [Oscillospiraceae bacterium]